MGYIYKNYDDVNPKATKVSIIGGICYAGVPILIICFWLNFFGEIFPLFGIFLLAIGGFFFNKWAETIAYQKKSEIKTNVHIDNKVEKKEDFSSKMVKQEEKSGILQNFSVSTWKCSKCGKENNGKFCSHCGTPKMEKKFCSSCGNELKNGQKFCAKCGSKI